LLLKKDDFIKNQNKKIEFINIEFKLIYMFMM